MNLRDCLSPNYLRPRKIQLIVLSQRTEWESITDSLDIFYFRVGMASGGWGCDDGACDQWSVRPLFVNKISGNGRWRVGFWSGAAEIIDIPADRLN